LPDYLKMKMSCVLPEIPGGWPQTNPGPDSQGRIGVPDVFDDPFDPSY